MSEYDHFLHILILIHTTCEKSERLSFLAKSVLQVMQDRYIRLFEEELTILNREAEEESLRIASIIAAQPPPGIPEFSIADPFVDKFDAALPFIDDFAMQRNTSPDEVGMGFGMWNDKLTEFDDDIFEHPKDTVQEEKFKQDISEEERSDVCSNMKTSYDVLVGVSWGKLPYDLQSKWKSYECDAFFS